MRSAVLRGREHRVLGEVVAVSEGPAALAMCLGGARKRYAYTDPNEDAALFALGSAGVLVAVADGHRGFEASEIAIDHLIENPGPQWTDGPPIPDERWERYALAVLRDANAEILREVMNSRKLGSRTTLAVALVTPDTGRIYYAAIGDSHIFRVTDRHAEDLAIRETDDDALHFLGNEDETAEALAPKCSIGVLPLADTRALVLASDGLSERRIGVPDPESTVLDAVDRAQLDDPGVRPIRTARAVVDAAVHAQQANAAGDNTCSAVLWMGDWLDSR